MRHGVKSYSFSGGSDANKMLLKKLIVNFLEKGALTTTETKAKFTKSRLEKLIEKAKVRNEANKNFLLKTVSRSKTIEYLFNEVGPAVKNIRGGYVKIIKMGHRSSDGAQSAKIVWAHPIVKEEMEKKPVKAKEIQP